MSTSPSSSTSHQWKHDVFASFGGLDTRDTFMSHLFDWLKLEKINNFDDQDREQAGKVIDDKIFAAIPHARIALVVFSKNYANSRWCLHELVKILNCKRDHNLLVFPIFYIRVSEVKDWARQSKFKKALKKLAGEERDNKRREWRNALEEASEISGFDLQKDANGCVPMILTPFEAKHRDP